MQNSGFYRKNVIYHNYTGQKMSFSVKDMLSKWEQIRSFLRICSYLLNGPLHFWAVLYNIFQFFVTDLFQILH